ncbi:MAG: hypothetical protein AAGD04_00680 [Pseudomonadota bacterium]
MSIPSAPEPPTGADQLMPKGKKQKPGDTQTPGKSRFFQNGVLALWSLTLIASTLLGLGLARFETPLKDIVRMAAADAAPPNLSDLSAPLRNGPVTQETYGAVRNFAYRIDGQANASFERLTAGAPHHLWYVTCRTHVAGICVAQAGPLIVVVDAKGEIRVMTEEAGYDRIYVTSGAGSYNRPYLFGSPLDPVTLGILTHQGAMIELEQNWRVRVQMETEGLDIALDFIAFLRDPNAKSEAWSYANRAGVTTQVPPALSHFADRDLVEHGSKWQVVPQRKPQSEFAIRAQQ